MLEQWLLVVPYNYKPRTEQPTAYTKHGGNCMSRVEALSLGPSAVLRSRGELEMSAYGVRSGCVVAL